MANTYKVQDGLTLAQKMAKGIPFTGIDMTICDIVSSIMYKAYPWRDALKVLTALSLTDANQDFAPVETDIFRITQFWIIRTDTTPDEYRDIDVAKSLTIDLQPRSPWQIRVASYQAGVNKFRLESAVRIPTGATFQIGGEYQPHPTRIIDTTDALWFADEHLEVFAKGLAYWAYRLADDSRAGTAAKTGAQGQVQYSGQLAEFMDGIAQMAAAEDFGNEDIWTPSDSMGAVDGRKSYPADLWPYLISN